MVPNLEYLTANGLSRYPFKDTCSLRDVSTTFILSDEVFLDLLVVSKKANALSCFLSAFQKASGLLTFTFSLLDSAKLAAGSVSFTVSAASVVERTTISYSGTDASVKIVPGPGMITMAAGDFSYTFAKENTELVNSAFIPYSTFVKSMTFSNTAFSGGVPVETVVLNTSSPVTVKERSNVVFDNTDGVAGVSIISGGGTGLYDVCAEYTDVIKTINFIPGNNGAFFLDGDGCYTRTGVTNGLTFGNHCKPKCTSDDLVRFGHYYNRIKDGVFGLKNYADYPVTGVKQQLIEYINDYMPILAARNTPYFVSKFAATFTYYSFMVGLYNPSPASAGTSISLSVGATAGHDANFMLVPKFGILPKIDAGHYTETLEHRVSGGIVIASQVTGPITSGIAGSVKLTLSSDSSKVAQDDGSGNISGESGCGITGGHVDYSNGIISLIVKSDVPEGTSVTAEYDSPGRANIIWKVAAVNGSDDSQTLVAVALSNADPPPPPPSSFTVNAHIACRSYAMVDFTIQVTNPDALTYLSLTSNALPGTKNYILTINDY